MNKETIEHKGDSLSAIQTVVLQGNMTGLTQIQQHQYYDEVCVSLRLNPITRPFAPIMLNKKLVLYATKDCTDQLRAIHGVSLKVLSAKEEDQGMYVVRVAARDKNGRQDEDMGAVTIAGLRGEARANAILKAITKAKRRVTLSLCGLGSIKDETEIEDIEDTSPMDMNEFFPAPQTVSETEPDIHLTITAEEEDGEIVAGEIVVLDTAKEFYSQYIVEMQKIFNDEAIPHERRMSFLHKLEELNQKMIDSLPKFRDGKPSLKEQRLNYNKALGAEKAKAKNGEK